MVSKLCTNIATEKFNCISLHCASLCGKSRRMPDDLLGALFPSLLCNVNGQFESQHGSVRSIPEHPLGF